MWITGPKFQTKRKQKSSLEKTRKNVWEARWLSKGPCSSSPQATALPSCFIVCNNLEERMAKVTPVLCKHGEKKGKLGAVSLSFPTSYCRQYRYISISVCYPHVRPALPPQNCPPSIHVVKPIPLIISLVLFFTSWQLKEPNLKG